jgi:hypothetical protein
MKAYGIVLPEQVIPGQRERNNWTEEFCTLRLQPVRKKVLQKHLWMPCKHLMQVVDVRKIIR